MDSLYSTSQAYGMYGHHQWTEESKPAFTGDEHDPNLSDKVLDSMPPVTTSPMSGGRRPSMLKVEDDFSTTATPTPTSASQAWQERPHDVQPVRSFSTSHAPMMASMNESAFAPIQHANTWSVPHSGTSTPTPMYGQIFDMGYIQPHPSFAAYPHDPTSAISMSPQSSQGGWGSTTSSDGIDQKGLISPTYRPTSPGTVMRPDGIRKKNARFEIPRERNLANIDAMILATTDEGERKELKQQKRLLRNRQAALDSRQRKKTHTEKLEAEKKVSEKRMLDMEEALARIESTLTMERDQFMQQRQHLENMVHALQYDRDEAIRTKTIETAELRRRNQVLEDCIKEMEDGQNRGYAPSGAMDEYETHFNSLGFEDSLDEEGFSLINGDDWKMEDHEQRQTTPKPTLSSKPVDAKAEAGFSWTTFYMCLLFGAFVASNGNNNSNMDSNAASAIASSIPSGEASNVLKTVLSSNGVNTDLLTMGSNSATGATTNGLDHPRSDHFDRDHEPSTGLDRLHQSLSTPSRRQEMAAAFSMSASSYQHLTDPFNDNLHLATGSDLVEPPPPPQPSALQKAFASMQAQKDDLDKITGMGSKARERSLLWNQVPPEVIKNFEAMVQQSVTRDNHATVEIMEQ